ncbi:alpha/beta fold hydrolase [Chitinophaga sp. 212800010-3]|uniref:alpha/beta hydrolase family protein n=1 Tax=unclassified Chitinophaga TaxID=2619133 RepID=UPI002DE2C26C|nr:Peptidase-S15 domain-containing protein [Chitinophaga sp. 212800010-3]
MYKGFWVFMLSVLTGSVAIAQTNDNIAGKWYGAFKLYYGEKRRVIVELEKQDGRFKGKMLLPDMGDDASLDFGTVVYRKDTLLLRNDDDGFSYTGVWDPATQQFKGIAGFAGENSALDLGRKEISKEGLYVRPQEPKPPYPYYSQEVKFNNIKDKVTLSGTFTRPASPGKYPVVIMLTGSGPQDRNEEISGHKPFLVLADYFARNGIATLRFDDRGVGTSTGDYDSSNIYDFAHDAVTAMGYLKTRNDVDPQRIGLLGHSEGAMVAQIVAANNPSVAFVVSMAGIGITGRQLVDQQVARSNSDIGESDSAVALNQQKLKPYWDLLATDSSIAVLRPKAEAIIRQLYRNSGEDVKRQMTEDQMVEGALMSLTPETISILRYDPLPYLKQIKCPFMAINGTMDAQVDANANLDAIDRALTENGNLLVTIRKFDGLNHLFQRCKTCTVNEYGELEQTIDPLVPEFIAHWILQVPVKENR